MVHGVKQSVLMASDQMMEICQLETETEQTGKGNKLQFGVKYCKEIKELFFVVFFVHKKLEQIITFTTFCLVFVESVAASQGDLPQFASNVRQSLYRKSEITPPSSLSQTWSK